MQINIRKGVEKDFPELLGLIKELAEFEKAPQAVTNSLDRMKEEQNLFGFFVAINDEKIVGAALYFFAYYTWVGKSLYLDDIYVKPEYRGQQIGSKLMRKIFELAKEENCQRLRWQVLDWNTPAVEMYRKMGAQMSNEWINCDFLSADIENYLQKTKQFENL